MKEKETERESERERGRKYKGGYEILAVLYKERNHIKALQREEREKRSPRGNKTASMRQG